MPFTDHTLFHFSSRNHSSRDPAIHQCQICQRYHSLRFCQRFLAMDSTRRNQAARRNNYCLNCLARTHDVRHCTSPDNCLKCGLPHHTLLHPKRHLRVQPSTTSVRDRIGQSNARSSQSTRHVQRRNTQPNTPTKRVLPKKRVPPHQRIQSISSTQPNQKILSEAIRSLAAVLCVTSST